MHPQPLKKIKHPVNQNKPTITTEPGKQELFTIREIDAPLEPVFEAFTTTEHVIQT